MNEIVYNVEFKIFVATVKTLEFRQKKAKIGGSSGLKCHDFLPRSSRKVSSFSTDLSVTKNLYFFVDKFLGKKPNGKFKRGSKTFLYLSSDFD